MEKTYRILTLTNISADDHKKYNKVIKNLDAYFKVRRNTFFKKTKFSRPSQREGESVEQCITDLYELSKFGNLKEKMLHNLFVVGIHNLSLSEKMTLRMMSQK